MEENKNSNYSDDDEPLTKSNVTIKESIPIDTQAEPKKGRPKKPEDEKKSLKKRSDAQIASFEKARQVRQEKIALQKKEKEEHLAKLYMESKQKEQQKEQPKVQPKEQPKETKRQVKKQYVEDSSESEDEIIVVKKKPKKTPKKKIIYVESSDESDTEDEPIVSVKRQTEEYYDDPFSRFV